MSTIIGIDPGKSGGIAIIKNGQAWADKMPETEKDLWDYFDSLLEDGFAYLEKVHAMPKQGVTSTFSFGQNFGMLIMALTAAAIPFELVTPQRWQKELGCLSHGDKNVTKRRAQQLFPGLTITHATADALLIAEYGRRARNGN